MIDLAELERLAAEVSRMAVVVEPFGQDLDHPAWRTGEAHATYDAYHRDRRTLQAACSPGTVAALVQAARVLDLAIGALGDRISVGGLPVADRELLRSIVGNGRAALAVFGQEPR